MKILITNIASVTAISITKILKKSNIKNIIIWGTEAQKYGYNSGSMLVDHYIQVPEVSSNLYSQNIIHICKKYHIDVLIPILDEELYLFSKVNIYKYVNLLMPNIEIIQLFRNKLLANKELYKIIPQNIPKIYNNYNSVNNEKIIIREIKSIGSQGILVKEKASIKDFNDPNCFVQKYINGSEYTVDILADSSGKLKLVVPRERIQIKNGVSTKIKIAHDLEIIKLCELIYDKYCIPGLSNVQFIKCNNDIYFIELNMRFAGMGIASVLASYDFLTEYILYLMSKRTLGSYSENMKKVKWDSVICRYYEETVLMQ